MAALLQAPGRLVTDTKLDLVVFPTRFLGRALHLWDPLGGLGQVPNQAAGYIWPMGAFFALGDQSPVPMWLVQRLWLAAVLCCAALGIDRLARALGIGGPGAAVAGGAYALSVNVGGLAGAYSGTVLPIALAPWILLPLVQLTHARATSDHPPSPRRAAARSALALTCAGGINATATLAAAILPAAWILTQLRGRVRTSTAAWWGVLAAGSTAWWWGPLLVQSKYGIAFDKYTERAAITTATSSVLEVVRGTHYWLGRLTDLRGHAWIPSAEVMGSWAPAALALGVVGAAGWYGLTTGRIAARRFWLAAAIAGTVAMASGFSGPGGWRIADLVQDVLDGPATPLRNIYKFDVLVRIPLALGLAALGPRFGQVRRSAGRGIKLAGASALATLAVLSMTPFLSGKALPDGRFSQISPAWEQAATWLGTNSAKDDVTLVVPAAPFGQFVWGRTLDDPLQPLAKSRWATRDIIPLGADGGVVLLDAVQRVLERGEGDPGLAPFLRRSGVRFVVARHDLDPAQAPGPQPGEVHDTLVASGLLVAETFGATRVRSVDPYRIGHQLVRPRLPDIEVFEVPEGSGGALSSTTPPALLVGDAESLLAAARLAVMPEQLTVDSFAAADLSPPSAGLAPTQGVLLSDRPTRRAIDGTAARSNLSYALGPNERPAGDSRPIAQRSTTNR